MADTGSSEVAEEAEVACREDDERMLDDAVARPDLATRHQWYLPIPGLSCLTTSLQTYCQTACSRAAADRCCTAAVEAVGVCLDNCSFLEEEDMRDQNEAAVH